MQKPYAQYEKKWLKMTEYTTHSVYHLYVIKFRTSYKIGRASIVAVDCIFYQPSDDRSFHMTDYELETRDGVELWKPTPKQRLQAIEAIFEREI